MVRAYLATCLPVSLHLHRTPRHSVASESCRIRISAFRLTYESTRARCVLLEPGWHGHYLLRRRSRVGSVSDFAHGPAGYLHAWSSGPVPSDDYGWSVDDTV